MAPTSHRLAAPTVVGSSVGDASSSIRAAPIAASSHASLSQLQLLLILASVMPGPSNRAALLQLRPIIVATSAPTGCNLPLLVLALVFPVPASASPLRSFVSCRSHHRRLAIAASAATRHPITAPCLGSQQTATPVAPLLAWASNLAAPASRHTKNDGAGCTSPCLG